MESARTETVENGAKDNDDHDPISGDVIGDTAYSQRFVLKILLKLANLDTLAQEIKEPDLTEELCRLWDMTTERDVVLYLQSHNALNLFTFAMPAIDTPRIIEIIIGTIANMCCHKEVVDSLLADKDLLVLLLHFLESGDSRILSQLLRLVNACLFVADNNHMSIWLDMFKNVGYADALYFILNSCTNKQLLMTAFESLNTICLNCQIEGRYSKFREMFLTEEAAVAVYTGHWEYCNQANQDEKLERLHIITLQVLMILSRIPHANDDQPNGAVILKKFDNREMAVCVLRHILVSYESRMDEYHNVDLDFIDVIDAAIIFVQFLELNDLCTPDKYFTPCYCMWKRMRNPDNRRTENTENVKALCDDIKEALSDLMATYMAECSDENFLKLQHDIGVDYENIVSQISDTNMRAKITNRALNYQNVPNKNKDS